MAELRFGHGPQRLSTHHYRWVEYLESLDADDFLNFVTLVSRTLHHELEKLASAYGYQKDQIRTIAGAWISFSQIVFEQENLSFEIDSSGGVHPKVDSEFQRVKQEIIRGLNVPEHARVKQCVEDAYKHYDDGDHKQSIWSIFEAVETLFQGLVGDRLNRGSIESKLRPRLVKKFSLDEEKTWDSIAKSLSDWTDAFHQYRHGQRVLSRVRRPKRSACTRSRVERRSLECCSI